MDGSDPKSDVADAVVAEITGAGGNAIAVAGDVIHDEDLSDHVRRGPQGAV